MPRRRSDGSKVLRSRSSAARAGSQASLGDGTLGEAPSQPRPLRSRSSKVKSATPSSPQSAAIVEDAPGAVVQAFWQRTELCLVVRDENKPSGVRIRRTRAEHSCFIRAIDGRKVMSGSKEPLHLVLKASTATLGVELEGDYYRIKWRDRKDCQKYCTELDKRGVKTYEGMVSPVMRHMVDNAVPISKPRKCWVDIETDSRVSFVKAEEEARILCWCVYDEHCNLVGEGLLEEDTDADEKRILLELVAVIDNFDLIAAWNGDRFDFLVIKRRLEQRRIKVEWRRWQLLDHMLLFQRMNVAAESGEEKQSSRLDAVAHTFLGSGKHSFDASQTWQAWMTSDCKDLTCMKCRGCLLKYCRQDTRLMPMLEKETGFIEILANLAEACGTFMDSRGIKPSVQVEGFLQRLAFKTGHKFPTVLKMAFGEKYDGAYVMDPTVTGITKNVHVGDFKALYPSIIVTWNISGETIIKGKAWVEDSDELKVKGYSSSPLTKVNFDTTKQGILPKAVLELMRLREHWNKLKATFAPGSDDWKNADRKSTAYKVAANSFYGVMGSTTSRFFDRDVAESIAQCGKYLILKTVQEANLEGMDVIYADTDSVFVEGASRTEFELFVDHCNENVWPKILSEVGCKENLIDLAYEKEFERIIFGYDPKKGRSTKKKYIGRYAHYKGIRADPKTSKPEIKGFEYKRGDAIRYAREMQLEVIELLVGYSDKGGEEDPEVFEEVLDRWKDLILLQPLTLDDVMIGKRLKKPLKEYVRKMKKDGSGYGRQLPHIEIAREMEGRGEDVGEGVRIEYFIYNGGCSPIDARPAAQWDDAVDSADPTGPTLGDTIDRFVIWDKQVMPPTMRLLEGAFPGHDWKPWAKTRPPKARQNRVKKAFNPEKKPVPPTRPLRSRSAAGRG